MKFAGYAGLLRKGYFIICMSFTMFSQAWIYMDLGHKAFNSVSGRTLTSLRTRARPLPSDLCRSRSPGKGRELCKQIRQYVSM
jgi:hypothetical protein